jgi:hypothetical protein
MNTSMEIMEYPVIITDSINKLNQKIGQVIPALQDNEKAIVIKKYLAAVIIIKTS